MRQTSLSICWHTTQLNYRTSSSFPVYGILKGVQHPSSFRSRKTNPHWGLHAFFDEYSRSDALNLDRHRSASHVHFEDEIASPTHALAPHLWPPPGLDCRSKLPREEAEIVICKRRVRFRRLPLASSSQKCWPCPIQCLSKHRWREKGSSAGLHPI